MPVAGSNNNEVSLRDYVDRLLHEHERAHSAEHTATEQARRAAEADVQRRLNALNELREEVTKDRSQFLRNDVFEQKHEGLKTRITALEQGAIKDAEMHSNTIPAFRVAETTIDEMVARVSRLEEASRRAHEATAKTERQRKWLLGLTVTVILAVLAIVANVVINITQGVP